MKKTLAAAAVLAASAWAQTSMPDTRALASTWSPPGRIGNNKARTNPDKKRTREKMAAKSRRQQRMARG